MMNRHLFLTVLSCLMIFAAAQAQEEEGPHHGRPPREGRGGGFRLVKEYENASTERQIEIRDRLMEKYQDAKTPEHVKERIKKFLQDHPYPGPVEGSSSSPAAADGQQ